MARKKYTPEVIEQEAAALERYLSEVEGVPFVQEFARRRGYSSQRCSEFAKKNEDFAEALKKLHDLQIVRLVNGALKNKLNLTMAIFTLKNVAGWRDNRDLRVNGELKGGETRIVLVAHENEKNDTKSRIKEVSI